MVWVLAHSTFKVTTSASNITAGSLTDSGSFVTVGNASSMTSANASVTYTITGKRANGDAISLTKTQSFSRSDAGGTGATGPRVQGVGMFFMPSVAATALVANKTYLITSVGTTNFSSIDSNNPACQNVVGAEFLASGAGTGTGTAVEKIDSSSDADTLFTSVVGNPVDDDQAFFFSGTQSSPDNITVWIYDESSDTWTQQTEFIDGDLLVTGTVTTSKLDANAVTADKIQAGEVNASKLTIDDELILQDDAGFIAGRSFNSDYATSGFFVGRETRADGTQGFEVSSSSTDSHNRVTGLLHNEQDHLQILNPILRFGGSATGASTNYTTSSSSPHIDLGVNTGRTITVTALGGGGGGGGGHDDRGDNEGGTGDNGGTTTVILYDGPVANNVVLKTDYKRGWRGWTIRRRCARRSRDKWWFNPIWSGWHWCGRKPRWQRSGCPCYVIRRGWRRWRRR